MTYAIDELAIGTKGNSCVAPGAQEMRARPRELLPTAILRGSLEVQQGARPAGSAAQPIA